MKHMFVQEVDNGIEIKKNMELVPESDETQQQQTSNELEIPQMEEDGK